MTTKPYLVASDAHLGAVPRETERAFRDFLAHVREGASGLLLNGDLFDFWFEYRTVIPRAHFRVLASLADVVDAGVPVTFVGGNHDAWGGDFLRREVGIEVVDGPVRRTIAGRETLVAHGDGVGRGDLRYRALKRLIRNRATVSAFRVLHPDLGNWIADRVSTTEHKASDGDTRSGGRARHIEDWAEACLVADPSIELVLAGHCHVPGVREVAPGRFYVNSGDWIHGRTYVELDSAGSPPRLLEWNAREKRGEPRTGS